MYALSPLNTGFSTESRGVALIARTRIVTVVGARVGAIGADNPGTADARRETRGRELQACIDALTTAIDATTNVRRPQREGSDMKYTRKTAVCVTRLVGRFVGSSASCLYGHHLPCYVAFSIRASPNMCCPACRTTVTVEEADRRAIQEHRCEVIAAAMASAR